jgi:phosphoribosylamine---glycine ligase
MKGLPLVIKTNGYPGDKEVFLVSTIEDAVDTLKSIMKEKIYGDSGNRIIIEEHLKGERISFVTIADNKTILPLASLYKYRGMSDQDTDSAATAYGSYGPVPLITKEMEKNIMEKVLHPVHEALNIDGIPFKGFISADIIMQKDSIYLSELEFGFGDLEPQTIMPGLKADIGELMLAASEGKLSDVQIKEDEKTSVCMALFSKDEPSKGSAGVKIIGLDTIKKTEDIFVFHENTVFENRDILTPGGTALYITATGADLKEATVRAYGAAEKIHFDGIQYSKDIGNKISSERESI